MTRDEEILALRAELAEIDRQEEIASLRAELATLDESESPGVMDYVSDVGSAVVSGVGEFGEMAADVLTLPENINARLRNFEQGLFAGEGLPKAAGRLLETPSVGRATERLFAPVTGFLEENRQVPRGESAALDMATDATRYGLPIVLSGGAGSVRGLPQAAAVLQRGARRAGAGSATGAAVGGQVAGEQGAAIGAGIGGVLADPKGLVDLGRSIIATGRRAGELSKATAGELRRALRQYVNEAYDAGSPQTTTEYVDKLFRRIERRVKAGEAGTVGQLADDPGLRQFELNYAKGESANARTAQQNLDYVDQQIDAAARAPMQAVAPDADPTQAMALPGARAASTAERVRERGALRQERASEQAESTLAQARAAEDQVQREQNIATLNEAMPEGYGTVTDPGVAGRRQVRDAVYKQYEDAWQGMQPVNLRENVPDMLKALENAAERAPVDDARKFNNLADSIDALATSPTKKSYHQIDREIAELRNAYRGDRYVMPLLNRLRNLYRKGLPEDSQALLRAADANYPKFLTVKNVGDKVEAKGMFTGDQLATANRTVAAKGAAGFEEGPMSGAVRRQVDAEAQARANTEAASAQARALRQGGAAEGRLAERTAKRIEGVRSSPSAKFGQYEPRQYMEAVKSAYSKTSPTADIRQLVNASRNDPAARDSLRRAFMDQFENSVSKDGTLTQGGLDKFKSVRPVFEESGLYSKAELDSIEQGLQESQKLYVGKQGRALAALPPERKRLVEVVSAIAGAKAGAALFGSPLIGAAIGRKYAVEGVGRLTRQKYRDLAFQMAVEPDKFMDIVNRLNTMGDDARIGRRIIKDLFTRAGLVTAESEGSED